jgi:hypothetical protein
MRKISLGYFEKQDIIVKLALQFSHSQGYMVSEAEMRSTTFPQYLAYLHFAEIAVNTFTKGE